MNDMTYTGDIPEGCVPAYVPRATKNRDVSAEQCKECIFQFVHHEHAPCKDCYGYSQFQPSTQIIQDSGDRTEFSTGAVRDMHEGKGRFDLLPWEAIWEVAKHCEEGAKKYGERNCEKGIPIHSLLDSGMRHLAKYMMGFKDEPHLRAAAWNILYAIYMEEKHPEMQDIPTRKENEDAGE